MRSTFALRIFRGKIILYLQAGKICRSSPLAFFHGRAVTGNGNFIGKAAIRSAKSPLQGKMSLQRAA